MHSSSVFVFAMVLLAQVEANHTRKASTFSQKFRSRKMQTSFQRFLIISHLRWLKARLADCLIQGSFCRRVSRLLKELNKAILRYVHNQHVFMLDLAQFIMQVGDRRNIKVSIRHLVGFCYDKTRVPKQSYSSYFSANNKALFRIRKTKAEAACKVV